MAVSSASRSGGDVLWTIPSRTPPPPPEPGARRPGIAGTVRLWARARSSAASMMRTGRRSSAVADGHNPSGTGHTVIGRDMPVLMYAGCHGSRRSQRCAHRGSAESPPGRRGTAHKASRLRDAGQIKLSRAEMNACSAAPSAGCARLRPAWTSVPEPRGSGRCNGARGHHRGRGGDIQIMVSHGSARLGGSRLNSGGPSRPPASASRPDRRRSAPVRERHVGRSHQRASRRPWKEAVAHGLRSAGSCSNRKPTSSRRDESPKQHVGDHESGSGLHQNTRTPIWPGVCPVRSTMGHARKSRAARRSPADGDRAAPDHRHAEAGL